MSDEKIFTLENVPDLVGIDMVRRLQEAGLSAEESVEAAELGRTFAQAMVDASDHPDGCPCDFCAARCPHGLSARETCAECDKGDS